MPVIRKPSEEELQQYVDQATAEQSVSEYIDKYTDTLKTLLQDNPRQYRSYGPWWWVIKQALISQDKAFFPEKVDAETLEQLQYDKTEYGLVAAFLYADPIIGSGADYNQSHVLEDTNGNSIEYVIADDDMEGLELDAEIRRQEQEFGVSTSF
ncbi:MAG: hypothetical protein CMH98_06830 [Oceanospirillaceae bacterium]|nr:hypothetical protein [Oceanospirillaceae bacterium]